MAKMINLSMKLKQKIASCGSRMQKIGGLWVTAETISKNMGSLGDSSAENRGSLEPYRYPYIRVTSIMGVPTPPPHVSAHPNLPFDSFSLNHLSKRVIQGFDVLHRCVSVKDFSFTFDPDCSQYNVLFR